MFWCTSVCTNLRIESSLRLFPGRALAVWTRCGYNNRSRKDRHCNRIPLPLRRRYISHCNPLLGQECQRNTIVARNAREHPILAKHLENNISCKAFLDYKLDCIFTGSVNEIALWSLFSWWVANVTAASLSIFRRISGNGADSALLKGRSSRSLNL